MTAIEVGTGIDTPANIGLMPIEIYRSPTFVTSSLDKSELNTGENLTLSIELVANTSDTDMLFDIQATLPEGIVIVSNSHEGTQDDQVLTWLLTQASQSEAQNNHPKLKYRATW